MVTGGKVYLETERLLLRQFTETDIDNLFGLDSDPEVMRFVGGTPTARSAIEHDFLPACLRYYRQGNRYGFWAAIGKTTGDFLGWFHLRPRPDAGLNEPRNRLPAAPRRLGPRFRHGRIASVGAEGFHGTGRGARGRLGLRG
jgi:RimJ/RimL family protein N-acetyltransferase